MESRSLIPQSSSFQLPIANVRSVFRPEEVERKLAKLQDAGGQREYEALRNTYERMLERGPERFQVKPSGLPAMDHLYDELPNFPEVLDDLKRQLQAPSKTDAEKKDDEAKADESILDDPEFTQAAEDYPEVFGPVKKVISVLENRTKTAIERAERAERELSGISQERRDANLEVQAQIVAEAHPDYSSIAGSKEFAEWYKNQPRLVQEGVQRNAKSIVDGNEVAYIVKLYKDSAGISTTTKQPASGKPSNSGDPRRKHQLESASTPSNRGPAKVQGGVPDDENAAWEYFERMDEQKKQRAEQR